MTNKRESIEKQIQEIKEKLADAKARLPKHSVLPSMIIEIEDLEEELERLRKQQDEQDLP